MFLLAQFVLFCGWYSYSIRDCLYQGYGIVRMYTHVVSNLVSFSVDDDVKCELIKCGPKNDENDRK